jgi:hypothetical protein
MVRSIAAILGKHYDAPRLRAFAHHRRMQPYLPRAPPCGRSSSNCSSVPYVVTRFDRSPDQTLANLDGTYIPAHSLEAVSCECRSGQP